MAAAIAYRSSHQASSTLMDRENIVIKSEDQSRRGSNLQPRTSPARIDIQPSSGEVADSDKKIKDSNAASRPLAPPPRPSQSQQQSNGVDYFSSGNNDSSHFSREPNPFEKSFGQPSSEIPDSKSLLPPVAALTSPAPLAPEGASAAAYNFTSSLRSGPLSPAMLGGPVGAGGDYFGPQAGTAFPGVTPNESSLRTGLTPGGGGSMFPAPSPGSQSFLNSLANGGATPNTVDFHRTAINAAAASKHKQLTSSSSAPQENNNLATSSMDPLLRRQSNQQTNFGQRDSDAANGLFLLAQASNGQQASIGQQTNQYPAPPPSEPRQAAATSPNMAHMTARNGSLTGSAQGSGDLSEDGDMGRMATRSNGQRAAKGRKIANNSGRRKTEDTPSRPPASKKQKNSNIQQDMGEDDSEEEEEQTIKDENGDTRKMTDEEKRKNFLERNRVAALKCRQRKKQWLQNLQAKVEMFSTENDSLTAQVHQLRDEVVGLKTLLIQHKDCPVSQSQGLHQYFQQQQEFNPHANPYGMGLPNGHQSMPGPRR